MTQRSAVTALTPASAAAYQALRDAWTTRRPTAPVRALLPDNDAAAAYAVQQALIIDRLADGAVITGRKIGLTAPAVQAQLGVTQPDFGVLLDEMACPPDEPIDVNRLLQPRIEAEVAFILAADITDADADTATVAAAVDHAVAALEIVDSRIADWDISFVDTVADNASSGLYTLGTTVADLSEFVPRDTTMTMTVDGVEVSTGSGEACLGDPLNALAWLARTAIQFGEPLRAGQVVLSGALGPMVDVRPGAYVAASIAGLGEVHAVFTAR